MTILTRVTGFAFPADQVGTPLFLGAISLVGLTAASVAYYGFRRFGAWNLVYVIGATSALFFNVLVAISQSFAKVAVLKTLAPTQAEPPFAIAQSVNLLLFIGLGIAAVRRSEGSSKRPASSQAHPGR